MLNPQLSWTSSILPQIDQAPLFTQLNRNVPYTDPTNVAPGQTVLDVLLCPSAPKTSMFRNSPDPGATNTLYAHRLVARARNGINGNNVLAGVC